MWEEVSHLLLLGWRVVGDTGVRVGGKLLRT